MYIKGASVMLGSGIGPPNITFGYDYIPSVTFSCCKSIIQICRLLILGDSSKQYSSLIMDSWLFHRAQLTIILLFLSLLTRPAKSPSGDDYSLQFKTPTRQ